MEELLALIKFKESVQASFQVQFPFIIYFLIQNFPFDLNFPQIYRLIYFLFTLVNAHRDLFHEIVTINSDTAIATARRVALTDGVFVGISSGAAIAAALEVF